jgi:hypothetical protein
MKTLVRFIVADDKFAMKLLSSFVRNVIKLSHDSRQGVGITICCSSTIQTERTVAFAAQRVKYFSC